ncbi:CLUMA_CG013470, isoform A [Clunio marinus]|uniref:CLUMA_CG013470, isoform A n=1 Tax=Clunio marinus TaxID=568069 RepID=A0A1J1IKX0_9DIPT|nr:CLUMA_CG013470, isoform A [Clunio marinus]
MLRLPRNCCLKNILSVSIFSLQIRNLRFPEVLDLSFCFDIQEINLQASVFYSSPYFQHISFKVNCADKKKNNEMKAVIYLEYLGNETEWKTCDCERILTFSVLYKFRRSRVPSPGNDKSSSFMASGSNGNEASGSETKSKPRSRYNHEPCSPLHSFPSSLVENENKDPKSFLNKKYKYLKEATLMFHLYKKT